MRSFVDQANCNEIELDLEDESNRTYLGKNTPWKTNNYNTKCLLISKIPFIVIKPMKSTFLKQILTQSLSIMFKSNFY